MAADYNLPLGIDTADIETGFDKIERGLSDITVKAQQAGDALTEVMMQSAGSSDTLIKKLGAGAAAAENLKKVAKDAGVEIEKTLSGANVNPSAISGKVNVFVAKMKDVIGKPIDFKFNFDKKTMDLLLEKLKEAKGQTESFEIVLDAARARLDQLVKGSKPFNELTKQIKEADDFLNVLKEDVAEFPTKEIPQVIPEDAAPKAKSLRAELKEIKAELAALDLAGDNSSERLKELTKRGAELQDAMDGAGQRLRGLASDTKKLDVGIAAMRGLAGAFAVAQGALAAFGEQNEEVAKTIQKVQGAMAILQGIQEVANVLNRDSVLVVFLQSLAHKQNTAAVVEETAAVTADAAATEAATVATEGWTAALLANPITAIVAAVAIAAVVIYNLAKSEDDAAEATKRLNDALEKQQMFLAEDVKIIERRQKVIEAQAEFDRKKQSEITKTQIESLRSRGNAIVRAIEDDKKFLEQSKGVSDEDIAARKAAVERIRELEGELRDINTEGNVLLIKIQVQRREEQNKLAKDILAQKIQNADAEAAIFKQSQEYANQILQTQNEDIKNKKQKELAILRQSVDEKIQELSRETAERKKILENQRRELALDIDSDPKVLALKREGLARQEKLEAEAAKMRAQVILALRQDQEIKELEIIEKYRREREQLYFDIAETLLSIQKESLEKELSLNQLEADRKIAAIKAQNLEREDEENAINAVLAELREKDFRSSFEFDTKRIELDKQTNINRINEAKEFSGRSSRVQALRHIMELRAEQDAAEKQLALLKQYGKTAEDAEYQAAVARVNAAKRAVQEAVDNAPPLTIGQLLFPDASDNELRVIEDNARQAFSSLGTLVDAYSQLVQDRYQKIIDAKKAAVEADEKALDDLERQLNDEMKLRDQGLANNVNAIRDEMAAKSEARERDVREQQEAQKALEESQRRQAQAQTILQFANLATSATNIYLRATEVGGPVGVAVASFAIAAMIAAFATQRAAAAEATQSFGDGGEVDGPSHEQGGRKYYSDAPGGGVVELEGGEYVTNKRSTQKYKKLLEAINQDKLQSMTDRSMVQLLAGTGVHIQVDEEKGDILSEAQENNALHINNTIAPRDDKRELRSIDDGIKQLVKAGENKERRYEEGDYIVIEKGSKKTKIRKK